MVRKLTVVVEMQRHSGELPAVCFGGSVWKGKVYSKTRTNSQKQANAIISEMLRRFSAIIVVCTYSAKNINGHVRWY